MSSEMTTSVVLYCPHLGRDLSDLQAVVPNLCILVGEPTVRGEDGCLEMHQSVVRGARGAGLDRVFVMEDDCAFTSHFNFDWWCADADWARKHGYDVMVGGCTRTYDPKVVRTGRMMVEVSAFHSAHCIMYFQSGYDKVLQAVQPFDWSLGRDCGVRCVLTWPFVAVQRASFSGILQQQVNYVPLYEQHERELGRVLGVNV